ncbi:MAG: hypothetical protein ACI4GW_09395 [Lachnospiraceae bacterium]
MKNSTKKQFTIHIINKRRLERPEFGNLLSDVTDVVELKKEIAGILEKNGRVYGIYDKKELFGIYIFERREDYFVQRDSGVKLGDKEFDYEKFWYGTSTAALQFKKAICLEDMNECKEKIEKDIRADLTEQIAWGQVAGVEWNGELMYRKNLEKKSGSSVWGYAVGYVIGFVMGWIIFDSIPMGMSFGLLYACMWGGISVATANGTEIDTLDFVKKREVEEDAAD